MKLFSWVCCMLLLVTTASAQLVIRVDTVAKEYFLSGSATGQPATSGGFPEVDYRVSWDNAQPYDNTYHGLLLGAEAFTLTGNSSSDIVVYLHGNGNVNGGIRFDTGSEVSLAGNTEVRYDYASWSQPLIDELESKAALGEMVGVSNGPGVFNLSFVAVPEPSTYAIIVGGLALVVVLSRRRK